MSPLRVVVTGACSDIGQSLIYMVAKGKVFGPNQSMELVLQENSLKMNKLVNGLVSELDMCNLHLVVKFTCTSHLDEAFTNADVIFLASGTLPQTGLSRNDVLSSNAMEFKLVGQALERVGTKSDVKILVVSEPQNINMHVIKYFAPSLKNQCITGLSRVDQNRAATYLARMLNVANDKVSKMTVWGNRSKKIFLDVRHAKVEICGKTFNAYDAIKDDFFLKYKFNDEVQGRQAEIEKRRNSTLCLPVAAAAAQHMKEWVHGTAPGTWNSMIVFSDGSYSIEKDLAYSFPVHVISPGRWEIVQNMDMNYFERENLDEMAAEVRAERFFAYSILHLPEAKTDDSDDKGTLPPWSFGAGPVVPCSLIGPREQDRMSKF